MVPVTIQMPEDVVEDMERIAPLRGLTDHVSLIRAYVGQGLRQDLERFDSDIVESLIASLKKRGIRHEIIEEALAEAERGREP